MEEPRSIWTTLRNLAWLGLVVALFFLPRDFINQLGGLWGQQRTAVIDEVADVPADTEDRPPAAPVEEDIRFTTANSLNMRAAPSPGGAVIASLPKGTRVSVTDTEGNWLFVKTDKGEAGWIADRFASADAPG